MKRKRVNYNELNEEIYGPTFWSKFRLLAIGASLLLLGFLLNFSLEEKVTKWMQSNLASLESCPIVFERAELSYFLPTLTVYKPTILGSCFGQPNNKLQLTNIKIALAFPSFYPLGIKLHLSAQEGKTRIHLYPIISFFSHYLDIKDTQIDGKIFAPLSSDNKSAIAGNFDIDGFIKVSSGVVEDGQLSIYSKNFYLPTQNLMGFDLTQINLGNFKIDSHFANNNLMKIDRIEIGKSKMPIELKLKGTLSLNSNSLSSSMLQLNGSLTLSPFMLNNFSFLKLFLPANNTTGTYQMRLAGPLNHLAPPQFN